MKKPFGSIRGPEDGRFDADLKYTPTKILDTVSGDYLHTGAIVRQVSRSPLRALIVGEYGAGKSMALRDIFQKLSKKYRNGEDAQFPVYVNLRDHIEQYDPDECLRRHASSVGMKKPQNLIKAWRSGLVYLLLDGFDELAPRIATSSRRRAQDLRNSAINLVRRLVEETPKEGSIILAGRNNYFDTNAELHSAIGVKSNWKIYEIHDLDDGDLARFIADHGWASGVPDWVPKKPLLISYVKQNGLIDDKGDVEMNISDPAAGWDFLVQKICEREVNQVYVALEPEELRKIYGRLATFARRRSDRRGPLSFSDCRRAFVEVTGVEPEERSVTAILRLPGLSGSLTGVDASELERGSRFFVDPDLADCLSAGDVEDAIRLPHGYNIATHEGIMHPLGELGRSVVFNRINPDGESRLRESLRVFSEQRTAASQNICADLVSIVFSNAVKIPTKTVLSNIFLEKLPIEGDADFSSFTFDTCGFEKIVVDVVPGGNMPTFQNCQIEYISAPTVMESCLRRKISQRNQIDRTEIIDVSYDTLRNDGAPEDYLDLISVIDKVFIQSTRGRQLGAIYRGRSEDRRGHIRDILDAMSRGGWISMVRRGGTEIIVPNMSRAAEAKAIIAKKDYRHYLVEGK